MKGPKARRVDVEMVDGRPCTADGDVTRMDGDKTGMEWRGRRKGRSRDGVYGDAEKRGRVYLSE